MKPRGQGANAGDCLVLPLLRCEVCHPGVVPALAVLARRETLLPEIRAHAARNLKTVAAWMAGESLLEWMEPRGGVVCFPRIRAGANVDPSAFYRALNERYATWVGPGHWFEQDSRCFRLGFGYPSTEALPVALGNVSAALRSA